MSMLEHPLPAVGLLLVGHGTRSVEGQAEFLQTATLVAEQLPSVPVEPCFLELAAPTIAVGVERMADRGARHIVVMPLLLFAAGHAKRDIPAAVASAAAKLNLSVHHTSHLGCSPSILELSAQRFREACTDQTTDPCETALVLVGRGSLDEDATAEMRQFTELRSELTPVGRAATCFLAMAEPRLAPTLAEIAGQGWRQIVVQPHLLFRGDLLDTLQAEVSDARHRWPDRAWLVAEHLGRAPALADALVARYRAARTMLATPSSCNSSQ